MIIIRFNQLSGIIQAISANSILNLQEIIRFEERTCINYELLPRFYLSFEQRRSHESMNWNNQWWICIQHPSTLYQFTWKDSWLHVRRLFSEEDKRQTFQSVGWISTANHYCTRKERNRVSKGERESISGRNRIFEFIRWTMNIGIFN